MKTIKAHLFFFSVSALLSLSACNQKSSSFSASSDRLQGIINGENVLADDPIAQTSVIVYDKSKSTICTGTLIRPNLVLTAAHCTAKNPADLSILFGQDMHNPGLPSRQVLGGVVTDVFTLLDFTKSDGVPQKNWGDVAVLKFEGHDLPPGYKVASLFFSKDILPNETSLTVAGYGLDKMELQSTGYVGSGIGILRKAQVKLTNNQFSETEFLINTTADGKSACHGDSGGPVYQVDDQKNVVLVAITSRSESVEASIKCDSGTIYTSISTQQDFITAANKFLESTDFIPGTPIPLPAGM